MPRRLTQQRMTFSDLERWFYTSSTPKSTLSASRAISAVVELLVWRLSFSEHWRTSVLCTAKFFVNLHVTFSKRLSFKSCHLNPRQHLSGKRTNFSFGCMRTRTCPSTSAVGCVCDVNKIDNDPSCTRHRDNVLVSTPDAQLNIQLGRKREHISMLQRSFCRCRTDKLASQRARLSLTDRRVRYTYSYSAKKWKLRNRKMVCS